MRMNGAKRSFNSLSDEHYVVFIKALKYFDAGDYWMCHEELEHLWLEYRGDDTRYIFWAILQTATTLYHVEQANLLGAKGQLARAKEKFKFTQQQHLQKTDIILQLPWDALATLVQQIDNNCQLSDFKQLGLFKFKPNAVKF